MVGGILAERTVKDIKPQILDNQEKIQAVIEQVKEQLKKKMETRVKFVEKYSIKDQTKAMKEKVNASQKPRTGGAGVLV